MIALYEIHEATWSIQCVRHGRWYRIAFTAKSLGSPAFLESNTLYSYGAVHRKAFALSISGLRRDEGILMAIEMSEEVLATRSASWLSNSPFFPHLLCTNMPVKAFTYPLVFYLSSCSILWLVLFGCWTSGSM